jgi:hypothetical protein
MDIGSPFWLGTRSAALKNLNDAQRKAVLRLLLRVRNAPPSSNIEAIYRQEIGNDAALASHLVDFLKAQGRINAAACNEPAARIPL